MSDARLTQRMTFDISSSDQKFEVRQETGHVEIYKSGGIGQSGNHIYVDSSELDLLIQALSRIQRSFIGGE